jgi:hypothetical protein
MFRHGGNGAAEKKIQTNTTKKANSMKTDFIAYTYQKIGNGLKERLHVKAFKNKNDLDVFLCKQTCNRWHGGQAGQPSLTGPMPGRNGVYASAGGAWHNVKKLDSSILAHI